MNDLENLYESLIDMISEMMAFASTTAAMAPFPVTPVSTEKSGGQHEGSAMYKYRFKKSGKIKRKQD